MTQHVTTLLIGVAIAAGMIFVGSNIAPDLLAADPYELANWTPKQIALALELLAIFILLGGFCLEELVAITSAVIRVLRSRGSQTPTLNVGGNRWMDLAYVFVLIFGSLALYLGFVQLEANLL